MLIYAYNYKASYYCSDVYKTENLFKYKKIPKYLWVISNKIKATNISQYTYSSFICMILEIERNKLRFKVFDCQCRCTFLQQVT